MSAAGVAVLVAAALNGCTGGDPVPDWTPTAATPVAQASPTPSTDPAAIKPERPAAMDVADAAGAEAAARYFLALYGYAFATGDTESLVSLSDPECVYCSNVTDGVTAQKAAGARTAGGAIEVGTSEAVEVTPGTFFTVRMQGQQAPWELIDAQGETVERSSPSSGAYLFTFVITHSGDAWKVREVQFDALPG